jgi:hypothetical protein
MNRLPLLLILLGCASDAHPFGETYRVGDTVVVRVAEPAMGPDLSLTLETTVGTEGDHRYEFGGVALGAARPDGSIIIYDGMAREIREFNRSGSFVQTFGRNGAGPGEHREVNGLGLLPDGRLAIADARNGRVTLYSPSAEYLSSWPTTARIAAPNVLFTDQRGYIVLAAGFGPPRLRGYILHDDSGVVVDTVFPPAFSYTPPRLNVENCVVVPPFAAEAVDTWSVEGAVVVGLPTSYQFEVLRDSIRLRVEVDRAPVPVKVEERREQRESTLWWNRQCYPWWNWDGADIPAHKPAYRSIRVDAGSRYWVELYTEAAEDLTITTAAAAGADEPPVLRWREPSRHDIFTPEGALLGTVTLPDPLRILALGDGFVWGTTQEPDGIPRLFLYRIPALD